LITLMSKKVYDTDDLPQKGLTATDETAPTGIKTANDRVIVLGCANTVGRH
jgi:hypothetical protein